MSVSITFLGASGTVTGSKYLVDDGKNKVLIDCGLFQGDRRWREENWTKPDFDLSQIDAVLLTHAHIDHTGMLPRFYKLGLKCPIYCSKATHDLSKLLLPDSAHLQEEEAEYRERRGKSRHHPALPLYTQSDAFGALRLFKSVKFSERIKILDGVYATWKRAGHILGAGSINLEIGSKQITFSGDLGCYQVPILKDPEAVEFGDLLLIESTYGDKEHVDIDPREALANAINKTVNRGGVVVIPSFAVGRAQLLLYYLRELKSQGKIDNIPVIVDSPMASDATELYVNSPEDYDHETLKILESGDKPFLLPKLYFTKDRSESIKLNSIDEPMIIISASGMLSGGRILHHLKNRIADKRNTVLMVGHQPDGGRGDWLLKGNKTIRILGDDLPVNAEILEIGALSAHGDRSDLLRWCRESKGTPKHVAVVHGEPETALRFSKTLKSEFGWNAFVPSYKQKIEL